MPELVRDSVTFEDLTVESYQSPAGKSKERYLVMALISLLAVNLVVVFGAITFYYLLVKQ